MLLKREGGVFFARDLITSNPISPFPIAMALLYKDVGLEIPHSSGTS